MTISVSPLAAPFGAEVGSLRLSALTGADREQLNRALAEYGILVVRHPELSTEEHVAFTRVFGEPDVHPIESIRLKGVPEIIELKVDMTDSLSDDDSTADHIVGGISWHSDLTYTELPSRGSLLYAVDVPPEGGDTGFIDTASVYEALPGELRNRLFGLEVVHSFEERAGAQARKATENGVSALSSMPEFPEVVHPLVHRHPISGQPVLNISPTFARSIVGWSKADSDALLEELGMFATQERFTYFHKWTAGDLVIWDNWQTMHTATGHKRRYRRCMLRTTIRGDRRLVAA